SRRRAGSRAASTPPSASRRRSRPPPRARRRRAPHALARSHRRGRSAPGRRLLRYPVRSGIRKRRENRLDPLAQVLERRRQDELLAEVRRILVRREAGPEGRDLEQDAARLAEVDRAEPEAVDDLRRMAAGGGDAGVPPPLLLPR